MRAEKANAFFSDFCQFEEGDHLKALMIKGRMLVIPSLAWR